MQDANKEVSRNTQIGQPASKMWQQKTDYRCKADNPSFYRLNFGQLDSKSQQAIQRGNASRPARCFGTFCPEVLPGFSLLFLWGGRGCGGRATAKATDYRQCNGAGFAVKWSRRQRAGFYPVPRCRRRNGTAKILSVKGLRVEILHQQNTTRPLTDRIGIAVLCTLSFLLRDAFSLENPDCGLVWGRAPIVSSPTPYRSFSWSPFSRPI